MSAGNSPAAAPSTIRSDQQPATTSLIARPLDLAGRAILLATDGSPCAVAAARGAQALAARHHAQVHVLSVVDTRSAAVPPAIDIAIGLGDAIVGAEIHREQERAVRTELSTALGQAIDWPVKIKLGTPSAAIVREAQQIGAALIVLGLRRHGRLDRAVNDETTLNVMRAAACPVLGVVAELTRLPRRILAAVDFGQGSLVALGAARAVAGPDATLVLAHVNRMHAFALDEGQARIHELGLHAGFQQLARELGEDGVASDQVVLEHTPPQSPAQTLLAHADAIGSDLITAGSVQYGRLERWLVGSVSTELVRDGRRSVLIVPPPRRD